MRPSQSDAHRTLDIPRGKSYNSCAKHYERRAHRTSASPCTLRVRPSLPTHDAQRTTHRFPAATAAAGRAVHSAMRRRGLGIWGVVSLLSTVTFFTGIATMLMLDFAPAIGVYVALVLASTVALVMALRGGRPRLGVYCEQCDYNLAGLPADATACPECGNKIAAHQSR
jgi:hypothetical protein